MPSQILAYTTAEGAEHENTTTEGSVARHTFPPGSLTAGKLIEFGASIVVNDNNSTDTYTSGVRWGTTSATPASNTALFTAAAVDVADADVGGIRGEILVQSSTRAVAMVTGNATDATGTTAVYRSETVLTIDPTATYYLDVTGDWSAAHADDEAAAAAFYVKETV